MPTVALSVMYWQHLPNRQRRNTMTKLGERKRHRWTEKLFSNLGSGPKFYDCADCGLQKITEWDEVVRYSLGNRGWSRFVPTCPPSPDDPGLSWHEAEIRSRHLKKLQKEKANETENLRPPMCGTRP